MGVTKLHVKHGCEIYIFFAIRYNTLIYISGVKSEWKTIWHQIFIEGFLLQQQYLIDF
jgi:hypothetical protein